MESFVYWLIPALVGVGCHSYVNERLECGYVLCTTSGSVLCLCAPSFGATCPPIPQVAPGELMRSEPSPITFRIPHFVLKYTA